MHGITKASLISASKTKSGLLCFNRKMRDEGRVPWDYAFLRYLSTMLSYHRDSFVSGAIGASETLLCLFLSRYPRFFLYSRSPREKLQRKREIEDFHANALFYRCTQNLINHINSPLFRLIQRVRSKIAPKLHLLAKPVSRRFVTANGSKSVERM